MYDSTSGIENSWFDQIGKLEANNPLDEVYLAEKGEKPKPLPLVLFTPKNNHPINRVRQIGN